MATSTIKKAIYSARHSGTTNSYGLISTNMKHKVVSARCATSLFSHVIVLYDHYTYNDQQFTVFKVLNGTTLEPIVGEVVIDYEYVV